MMQDKRCMKIVNNYTNKKEIFFALIGLFFMSSCSKPNYCECKEISLQAIYANVGLPNNVNLSKLKDCEDKIKDDNLPSVPPGNQTLADYIQQVSYEMCEFGFYEGKGLDNKKYYPKSEK